jgi:hypothetical protein
MSMSVTNEPIKYDSCWVGYAVHMTPPPSLLFVVNLTNTISPRMTFLTSSPVYAMLPTSNDGGVLKKLGENGMNVIEPSCVAPMLDNVKLIVLLWLLMLPLVTFTVMVYATCMVAGLYPPKC